MQAIEFNSRLEHGQIAVPKTIHLVDGQPVRVLILLEDNACQNKIQNEGAKNVLERTAGAWQGETLARAPQGEYEQRLGFE